MFNLQSLVRPNIWKLQAYSSARSEFKGVADIFLDANESPFDTGYNRYPDPLQLKVKAKIAALKQVDTEKIFLGNGSDEAIDLLIRIFCEPRRDEILICPPTYGMYQVSADIADVKVLKVNLTTQFQLDVPSILQAITPHTKLMFICSPNNPTGNSINLNHIQKIAQKFYGILVIDEAYIDFAQQVSFLSLFHQHPNIVVLQTFSKAWGLAGIRLGMAFAQKPIIHLLNKVKPPYNVNQLTQEKVLKTLENSEEQKRNVENILKERKRLVNHLQLFTFIEKTHPSDANFLLLKVKKPIALYQYLIQKKIIVRNRSNVVLCDGCLRITIGTSSENQQLLHCLQQYKI